MRKVAIGVLVMVAVGCGEPETATHTYTCEGQVTCPTLATQPPKASDGICAEDETDARLKMRNLHPTEGSCSLDIESCTNTGKACE